MPRAAEEGPTPGSGSPDGSVVLGLGATTVAARRQPVLVEVSTAVPLPYCG